MGKYTCQGENYHNHNFKVKLDVYSVILYNIIPDATVNCLSISTVCTLSLALTTRHSMFWFIEKVGSLRSTDILEVLAVLCSFLSECAKFLQVLRSFPNITVQDLMPFVLVVFKKIQVICRVSPSYVNSTLKNVFLEPIGEKFSVIIIIV